jgi:predicted transcriptional regulator
MSTTLDRRQVRAVLARHEIPARELARTAGLTPQTISRILRGRQPAGELAKIKIHRALEQLGVASEVSDGQS